MGYSSCRSSCDIVEWELLVLVTKSSKLSMP